MWNIIAAPDDADAFVEKFPTKKAAIERAATIMSWDDWDIGTARTCIKSGCECTLGDAGSIRIEKEVTSR